MKLSEIGVVVPTWNSATTLEFTLASLLGQRGCSIEVVAADSGSTDGTLELCARWNVRTIYVPPGNMYRAINAGIAQLDAAWVTYLNSDDMVYADSYATLLAATEGFDLVYGDCDFVDAHNRFLYSLTAMPEHRLAAILRGGRMPFNPAGVIFRKAIYEQVGGFSEAYRTISDLEFFGKCAAVGGRFKYLPEFTVAAFRMHSAQISQSQIGLVRQEIKDFLNKSSTKRSHRLFAKAYFMWRNTRSYVGRRLRTGRWRRWM
jgi:glycosyltransferase involved in cell wall biosynthesis